MSRVAAAVALALAALGGCGSEDGIGLRVVGSEVLAGETPKVSVEVLVTDSCFFSVLLNGNLRASGRWGVGRHDVLIPGYLLRPEANVLRIDVAGEDGSSASVEEPLAFCELGALACGDVVPDAGIDWPDAGGPEDVLCEPCDDDETCGGLPNECVFLWVDEYGDEWGLCGTYCGADPLCPPGTACTYFHDAVHESWLCFPPAPDFECS